MSNAELKETDNARRQEEREIFRINIFRNEFNFIIVLYFMKIKEQWTRRSRLRNFGWCLVQDKVWCTENVLWLRYYALFHIK